MISKEKKDTVFRDVVKPELKQAGYRTKGNLYYSLRNDCYLYIALSSGRFNSAETGFNFRFDIWVRKGDLPTRLSRYEMDSRPLHEDVLLPDCGYLHPYHTTLGYEIDGYKNYRLQDMDVEDIKARVRDDLRRHILPQLDEITCYDDWTAKRAEWSERFDTLKMRLLRYYTLIQSCFLPDSGQIAQFVEFQRIFELPAREIIESRQLYRQIAACSARPDEDFWDFILASLKK